MHVGRTLVRPPYLQSLLHEADARTCVPTPFYLFTFNKPFYLYKVDSRMVISPRRMALSLGQEGLAIWSNSRRQEMVAICKTGCSTAVIVGWTRVHNLVPDMQHSETSSGMR